MRGCFGIMSMIKTIRFLKRFAAKQVRPCSDEGATVDLVPRGETLDAGWKNPHQLNNHIFQTPVWLKS